MIPASRKVTSTPGIRPTGSLRIALGERCFREPSLRSALVRRTGQRLTARDCQGNRRPHAPKCRAVLAAPCGHFASLVRSSSTARLPSENFVLLRRIWRPVQHFRRPSRSSAWFKGGETPPSELRALPMARWDEWDAWDNGFLKFAFGASRRI